MKDSETKNSNVIPITQGKTKENRCIHEQKEKARKRLLSAAKKIKW